jgi:hypothetical protein
MEELLDILDNCPNVKEVTFDNEMKLWTIIYKNGLNPDTIDSDNLFDFLLYA